MFVSDVSDFEFVGKVEPYFLSAGEEVLQIVVQVTTHINHVIIGGESTTLNKFLGIGDFFCKLKNWMDDPNKIVWGTCAGLILMSNTIKQQQTGGQLKVNEDQILNSM